MSHNFEPTQAEKDMVAKMYEYENNRKQRELSDIIAGAILDGQNQIHDLYKEKATAQEVEARMRRSFVYWKNKLNIAIDQAIDIIKDNNNRYMKCHEYTNGQTDTAGNLVKHWKCYCGTTACLENVNIQELASIETHTLHPIDRPCPKCGVPFLYANPKCSHSSQTIGIIKSN